MSFKCEAQEPFIMWSWNHVIMPSCRPVILRQLLPIFSNFYQLFLTFANFGNVLVTFGIPWQFLPILETFANVVQLYVFFATFANFWPSCLIAILPSCHPVLYQLVNLLVCELLSFSAWVSSSLFCSFLNCVHKVGMTLYVHILVGPQYLPFAVCRPHF